MAEEKAENGRKKAQNSQNNKNTPVGKFLLRSSTANISLL